MATRIKVTTSLPKLTDFQKDLLDIANRIIKGDIAKKIDSGVDIDGKRYPAKTTGNKRRLIVTGRLRRATKVRAAGKNKVILDLMSDRKEVGKSLQIDGVKSSGGIRRFNFFGVSLKAEKDSLRHMASVIKNKIKTARTKTRILRALK